MISLSESEKQSLDIQGFVVFHNLLDVSLQKQLQQIFERMASAQKQSSGDPGGTGTRHIKDLLNAGREFSNVTEHPKLLAAVSHVLQSDFHLIHLDGRDPLSGYGQQGLHTDWMARAGGTPFQAVTALCLLDDFTRDNGSTRVVPGTHLLAGSVPKSFADPSAHHRNEIQIEASAGSVLIFNGHLWHSGTRNNSNSSRRVLQCQFAVRGRRWNRD